MTTVPVTAGRALRTVVGTLDELRTRKVGDEWLRVRVREARRADLADDVRALFGERCVDVFVEGALDEPEVDRTRELIASRSPRDLYADYLASRRIDDPRLLTLFDEMLETVRAGDDEGVE